MARRLTADEFGAEIVGMAAGEADGGRKLVALAGPPGAGKSTLASRLLHECAARVGEGALAVLAMDGFHYDDAVLEPRGLLPLKGAPETFDVGGLAAMLRRLEANAEPAVAVPVFDRSLEIARAGAALIARQTPIVLVEGNYLLLAREPWSALAPRFAVTATIAVDEAVLSERLRRRWIEIGCDEATIAAKVDGNDLPNGRLIRAESTPADIVISG